MIFVTPNFAGLLMLPVMLVVWGIDCFLFLMLVRAVCAAFGAQDRNRFVNAVHQLTEPPVHAVSSVIARRASRPMPLWLSWLVLVFTVSVVRALLAGVVIAVSSS